MNFFSNDKSLNTKVDLAAMLILRETGVPSASIAVVKQGKIIYVKAYGNAKLDPQTAAMPDIRYAIGSISKQFTASSILLLEQEDKLTKIFMLTTEI